MVTWNGATVSDRVLIYHDEISSYSSESEGALICRHNTAARVGWFLPTGADDPLADHLSQGRFVQSRSEANIIPSVSRLLQRLRNDPGTAESLNGLWQCRLNTLLDKSVSVGIYHEG